MKRRTTFCVLITLFILLISGTMSDAQVHYMYWTDLATGKIQRANLNGSNVEDIVTQNTPINITLDMYSGKMYWTDRVAGAIRRANLDGTNIETLFIGGEHKEGIALDISGGKMYWSEWNRGIGEQKIRRANLDGSNVEDLITGFFPGTNNHIGPRGITLDLSQGKVYWTDTGAGAIRRANLDGSNTEDVITGLDAPHQISLDFNSDKIYWGDWDAGKIQRANFDGSHIEDLVVGLSAPAGIALDSLNSKMYWVERRTGKIQRANLNGSNVEDLVTGLTHPFGIALSIPQAPVFRLNPNVVTDQTFTVGTPVSLTLPTATGGSPPYTYSISALPPGLQFDPVDRWLNGTPTTLVNAHPVTYTATDATGAAASLTFTITVQDTPSPSDVYIYWSVWSRAGSGKIQRANLNGTNLQDLVTGLTWARDVALDITGNKMYWVDANTRKVQRANLDGTNVEDLVRTQGSPYGVAVDTTNRKIYWSTWRPGKIRRANLDGSNVEDFVTGLSEPEDIALDLSAGKIYWTDTVTNKIQRANLDGSNVEDLVTVGLSHPLGMALDVAGGKMYWTNTSFWSGPWPGHDKIQRANLDGTNVEDLVTTGLTTAHGIALDVSADKMYWANAGKIQRANLDGSNVEDVITNVGALGIALGIRQTTGGLRFTPDTITDQTFTVGTPVSLTLPTATGGTPPYTYTLTPILPAGLSFDPIANGPGSIGGTPTAALLPTLFTYTVTDAIGASASLTFTITVELNLDVNGDGKVDVLDLVWVAVSYQMQGNGLPADVNADGVVNVQDLVAVANAIDAAAVLPAKIAEEVALAAEAAAAREGAAGAPRMPFSSRSEVVSGLTAHRNVAAALADARTLGTGDVYLEKWLPLLEELLQVIAEIRAIPEATALLPNYPNPFNPETWIPYHLAQDANVTLTIYDVRGVAVRTLMLGQQAAGVYESRARAAYWDGRNQIGEPVASSLYFYTLTAGDFTATRKLLIAK